MQRVIDAAFEEFDREAYNREELLGDRRATIGAVLRGQIPAYQSPVMEVKEVQGGEGKDGDSWQMYDIPDGVVGNVITFTLWGKHTEQFSGTGYYACVDRIAARGVPLFPPAGTNGDGNGADDG